MDAVRWGMALTHIRMHGNVRRACRELDIHFMEFYRHAGSSDEARAELVQAKEDGMDGMADEVVALTDEPKLGRIVKKGKDKDGNKLITIEIRDNTERTRLQIHARMWLMAKLKPAKYGEHISVDQTVRHVEAAAVNERIESGRKRLALVR